MSFLSEMLEWITGHLRADQLELAPGGQNVLLVRDGDTYSVVTKDLRWPKKDHRVGDIESLLQYLGRHGQAEHTTVFCDAERFVAVLEDRGNADNPADGVDGDRLVFVPEFADRFREWKTAFSKKTFSHKALRNFLDDHRGDIIDREVLAAISQFRATTKVEYDGDLDSGETVGVKVTMSRGQRTESGVIELPRQFSIELPLQVGWANEYRIDVRLEAEQGTNGGIAFMIEPKNLTEVMHQLVDDLIAHVREQLGEGWLVVRGKPCTATR